MGACASGVASDEPQLLPGQQPQQRDSKGRTSGRTSNGKQQTNNNRNSNGRDSHGRKQSKQADARNSKGKTQSKGRDSNGLRAQTNHEFLMKQMQNDMRHGALGLMDQSGSNLGISGVASITVQPSADSNLSAAPISNANFSSVINSNISRGDHRIKYNASPVVPAITDTRSSADVTPAPYERAQSPSDVVSISHSTLYLQAPPPAMGPTVYAAHSSAVSLVSSPNSTAPPSPTSLALASGDYAAVPALLLPWPMQQKAARQLEKGMEDLLSHPPLFLSLSEHPAAPGALPPVPPTRIQPLPVPSWSPFSSPRLSPGQEAPMLRRKLNSLAQKHVRMVLERMTPAQLESLACHSKNQPRVLAQHASASGARSRPPTGIQATPHGTPAASTTLPPPALVEHLVLGSPPGLNASSLIATPALNAVPNQVSSSMPTVSLDTPAPLPHSTAQCAPASENLSQLEYRLNLLSAKSEWKAQRSYGIIRISLFGPDAYRYQGIVDERIPPAPHQDQRMELEPAANSVLGFMRHTLHRSAPVASVESSPMQLAVGSALASGICSATASPMSGPLSGGVTPNYLCANSAANSARGSSCNSSNNNNGDKVAPTTCSLPVVNNPLRSSSSFLDLPGALQQF